MTHSPKFFSLFNVLVVFGALASACAVGDDPSSESFDDPRAFHPDALDPGGLSCDPGLLCGQALTCVDGLQYPTTCGPDNCDAPLGPCEGAASCDPSLLCGQALTCVDGSLYPTTCGPDNCDAPLGAC